MFRKGFLTLCVTSLAICVGLTPGKSFSAPPSSGSSGISADRQIPSAPSAPPRMVSPKATEGFQCERFLTHRGKVIACDSNVRKDAENLRPILQDVPAAIAELDVYQTNRARVRSAAYWGTAGLLVAVIGASLSGRFTEDRVAVRNISLLAGLALAGGSFVYALGVLQTNEAHLGNAVRVYNHAHPESPLELQFSTGISF